MVKRIQLLGLMLLSLASFACCGQELDNDSLDGGHTSGGITAPSGLPVWMGESAPFG